MLHYIYYVYQWCFCLSKNTCDLCAYIVCYLIVELRDHFCSYIQVILVSAHKYIGSYFIVLAHKYRGGGTILLPKFFEKKKFFAPKKFFFEKKVFFAKKQLSKKNENFFSKKINFPFRCRKKNFFSWKVSPNLRFTRRTSPPPHGILQKYSVKFS